jgi:hypothetical protein
MPLSRRPGAAPRKQACQRGLAHGERIAAETVATVMGSLCHGFSAGGWFANYVTLL